MAIMYKNRLLCIITNYVHEPWHIHIYISPSSTTPLILRWNKYDRATQRNPYVAKPNKSSPNWRKNLPKLEEDTLSAPATMLVNLFSVSQLILKIYAWAVPKMPHFGENSDIWPRYWPSKLKSRFLGTSFPRPTSISKWVGEHDYLVFDLQGCILPSLATKFSQICPLHGKKILHLRKVMFHE